MTNSWVITADQCIPNSTDIGTIVVAFGSNSRDPQQTQRVVEIRRFPGNDGTLENRGRDLLMLGVGSPFVIAERTTGHHQPIQFQSTSGIPGLPLRCVGWDMEPDPASPSDRLRTETLIGVSVESGVGIDLKPAGSWLWWMNTAYDKLHGILPTSIDVGTGCFYSHVNTEFQVTVHSGNPELRRDGSSNEFDEAFGVGLGDPLVRNWVANVMFGADEEPLPLLSKVGTCSLGSGTLELFSLGETGSVEWRRWKGAWTAEASIAPPALTELATDQPGVLCTPKGTIELFVRSVDGSIWHRIGTPGEGWNEEWLPVLDASTPITSGISVIGAIQDHFHLFARGPSGELRHAEYDEGWLGKWEDLGGALAGTPAASIWYEGRINIFVRWSDDSVYQGWFYEGEWQGWGGLGAQVTSDPATTSWGDDRMDILVRSAHGTALHLWYDAWWVEDWIDTGMPMPEGSPAMVSWESGRLDLFIGQGAGAGVWHAMWPRMPSPPEP